MTHLHVLVEDINPIPWMSPDISLGRTKGGKPFPRAYSPAPMRAYQNALKETFAEAYPDHEPFAKGTELWAVFAFWRRLDQYTTDKGRKQTSKRADATNMTKSTEDAFQKLLYHNDTDNFFSGGLIVEQSTETYPMVLIYLTDQQPRLTPSRAWAKSIVATLQDVAPPSPPGNVRLSRVA